MKVEEYWDKYLNGYGSQKANWNDEDGALLLGACRMYDVDKDEKYVSFIETYLASFLTEEGSIKNYPESQDGIDGISCGRILYFMYDKTGDEKYRKAIEFIMNRLRKCPRDGNGNFSYGNVEGKAVCPEVLYKTLPFYMEYETKYEKKEKYGDIIQQFENAEKLLDNGKKELKSLAWYLMALIDTMDNMSFEIYEQYRALQDAFKRAFKDALDISAETRESVMIGYCIIKACRMGILLKEKYAALGMKMIENPEEKDFLNQKRLPDDAEEVGMFLMAYGQYLQLKKEMDENG